MNTLTNIKRIHSLKRKASVKNSRYFPCFSEWHSQLQFNLQWINATSRVLLQRSMQALPKQLTAHWHHFSMFQHIPQLNWSTLAKCIPAEKIHFLGFLSMHKQVCTWWIKLRRNKHYLVCCFAFPSNQKSIILNERPIKVREREYFITHTLFHRYLLPYWQLRPENQVTWTASRLQVFWE